jgi:hypothetical protein
MRTDEKVFADARLIGWRVDIGSEGADTSKLLSLYSFFPFLLPSSSSRFSLRRS